MRFRWNLSFSVLCFNLTGNTIYSNGFVILEPFRSGNAHSNYRIAKDDAKHIFANKREGSNQSEELNNEEKIFEVNLDPSRPFRNFARDVKMPFLENPLYRELQVFYALLSGAAVFQNYIDNADDDLLRSFQFPLALFLFHLLCVSISVEVLNYKGIDSKDPESRMCAIKALLTGPLEVYRVANMDDLETREARKPLAMEVDTRFLHNSKFDKVEERRRQRLYGTAYDQEENSSDTSVVTQTLSFQVIEDGELRTRSLLKRLIKDSSVVEQSNFLYIATSQDENDRTKFKIIQKFKDSDQLLDYQTSATFELWAEKMREILTSPIDVIVKKN